MRDKPTPNLMIGVKPICETFSMTEEQFYMFLVMGLPVRKINGRWYGHRDNIEVFFRNVTHGDPIQVDPSRARQNDQD